MIEKPIRILRFKQLREKIGLGSTRTYELIKEDPSFPQPIQLTTNGRARGFIESEVESWLAGRIAATRGGNHAAA